MEHFNSHRLKCSVHHVIFTRIPHYYYFPLWISVLYWNKNYFFNAYVVYFMILVSMYSVCVLLIIKSRSSQRQQKLRQKKEASKLNWFEQKVMKSSTRSIIMAFFTYPWSSFFGWDHLCSMNSAFKISMPHWKKKLGLTSNVFSRISVAFQLHFTRISVAFQSHFSRISVAFQLHFSCISVAFQSHFCGTFSGILFSIYHKTQVHKFMIE